MIFILSFLLKVCTQELDPFEIWQFPLVIGQPNFCYLDFMIDYLPDLEYFIQDGTNHANLSIIQPIQNITSIDFSEGIQSSTNFNIDTGFESSIFYILTTNQSYYQGIVSQNGTIQLNQLNLNLKSQQNCVQIFMLKSYQILLLCINIDNLLEIIDINLETNITLNTLTQLIINTTDYKSLICKVQKNYNQSYLITLTYKVELNQEFSAFTYQNSQINLIKQLQSNSLQIECSQNLQYYFILKELSFEIWNQDDELIYIQDNNSKYFNIQFCLQEARFSSLAEIVIATTEEFQVYQFSPQNKNILSLKYTLRSVSIQHDIIYFQMHYNEIYLITNYYISIYSQAKQFNLKKYKQLSNIENCLVNYQRNFLLLLENQQLQLYLITQPLLYIKENQVKLLENQKLIILGQLGFSGDSQFPIQINFIIKNQTLDQDPVATKITSFSPPIDYPHLFIMKYSDIFIGPNVNITIDSNYEFIYNEQDNFQYPTLNSKYLFIVITECGNINSTHLLIYQTSNYYVVINYKDEYFTVGRYKNELISCSCNYLNQAITIAFQFINQVIVTQINSKTNQMYNQATYSFSDVNINSIAVIQDKLFIVNNNLTLSAFEINPPHNEAFSIQNYTIQNIFSNILIYPNYIFLDNNYSLLILSYKNNQSTYEIVNEIPYPQINNSNVYIGAVLNGIFLATINNGKSQLFLYQQIAQQIQILDSFYFEIDLLGLQYQNNKIQAIVQYNSIYLPLNKSGQYFIQVYTPSGTPYNCLSNIISLKNPIHIISYGLQCLGVQFNNQNFQIIVMGYNVIEIFPLFHFSDKTYELQFQSANITTNQTFKVSNYEMKIKSNQYWSPSDRIEQNNNQFVFSLIPSKLFQGSIEKFIVECLYCSEIKIRQPINGLLLQSKIFPTFIVNDNEILYILTKNQLYQFDHQTNSLTIIQQFEQQANCIFTFLEIMTKIPISLCYLNGIHYLQTVNTTNQRIISFSFSEKDLNVNQSYQQSYQSGILQIFVENGKKISANSFFITLQNNVIMVYTITTYSQKTQYSLLTAPFYLQININCPIFGFVIRGYGTYSLNFIIIKVCLSQSLSSYFNLESTNYTKVTKIYQNIQYLNLQFQLFNLYPKYDILTINEMQQIDLEFVKQQFLFQGYYLNRIFSVIFNITDGEILFYQPKSILYTAIYNLNTSFQIPQFASAGNIITSITTFNNTQPSLFIYDDIQTSEQRYSDMMEVISVINYLTINQSCLVSSCFKLYAAGQYVVIGNSELQSLQLYNISNRLDINLKLNKNQGQLNIQATNGYTYSIYSFQLIFNNEGDIDITQTTQINHIGLIILYILLAIILIFVVLFLYIKCKPKQKNEAPKQKNEHFEQAKYIEL